MLGTYRLGEGKHYEATTYRHGKTWPNRISGRSCGDRRHLRGPDLSHTLPLTHLTFEFGLFMWKDLHPS